MSDFDDNVMFSGFALGMFVGALIALFKAPRLKLNQLIKSNPDKADSVTDKANKRTNLITALTSVDPIEESIAQGKKAARRRRTELGLDQDD